MMHAIFFNIVIAYMLYAVIVNKLDTWLWICYGLVLTEGLVLLIFKPTSRTYAAG
ncbi:hypothetical protein SAMN05216436_108131 [bacterium A37T11]|nr:hypothetical protein SAMN05216436_108131 [bacterium A37T11]